MERKATYHTFACKVPGYFCYYRLIKHEYIYTLSFVVHVSLATQQPKKGEKEYLLNFKVLQNILEQEIFLTVLTVEFS